MPSLSVSESIQIKKTLKEVFECLHDFHTWIKWSPWLIAEPQVKISISDDGQSYQWDGQIVGGGTMNFSKVIPHKKLEVDLIFLKPNKSKALVTFELQEVEKETQVTWKMKSSLPWYLFWMSKRLNHFIANDYKRGLKLLKNFLELGKIHSRLDFIGVEQLDQVHLVGKRYQSSIGDFKANIEKNFGSLFEYCTSNCKENIQHIGYTLYHQFDFVKDRVDYTVGLSVSEFSKQLSEGYTLQTIPKLKVYSVMHIGQYDHLENAWACVMMHQNAKKFKPQKKTPGMEIYLDNPSNTPEKDIKTKISIPAQ